MNSWMGSQAMTLDEERTSNVRLAATNTNTYLHFKGEPACAGRFCCPFSTPPVSHLHPMEAA